MAAPFSIVDCDVHNSIQGPHELLPYLSEPWRTHVEKFGVRLGFTYESSIGVTRMDAVPPGGGPPGSDPSFTLEQLVNAYNMDYAILTTDWLIHMAIHPDPDFAAAIASAQNDLTAAKWLARSDKFRAAILIAPQDPALAAREIDRMASHPGFVEVIMSSAARMPYGQRFYHPIYEAAERAGLPVKIHPGSEGGGISNPPTAAGYMTNYFQWHTALSTNFMAHAISLVSEGVFEKFPGLRFIFCEGGVAWLPHLMWRMDKNFKALRSTVPWLKKMPSQYIRDHCFLTTQPVEEPDDFEQLQQIFNMIDAENILLFSSDYPHWDFDDPFHILRRLSPESKRKIFSENAKKLYKLK